MSYSEFIRGKYDSDDKEKICMILREMTKEEQKKILNWDFDKLWLDIFSYNFMKNISKDYLRLAEKYNTLKNSGVLEELINKTEPELLEPEWGFPKGRRNVNEGKLECAKREFSEETNYTNKDYTMVPDLHPVQEQYTDFNGITYRHIYYICTINDNKKEALLDEHNRFQQIEVGNIGWYSLSEAIPLFKNIEKKTLLIKVHRLITVNGITKRGREKNSCNKTLRRSNRLRIHVIKLHSSGDKDGYKDGDKNGDKEGDKDGDKSEDEEIGWTIVGKARRSMPKIS